MSPASKAQSTATFRMAVAVLELAVLALAFGAGAFYYRASHSPINTDLGCVETVITEASPSESGTGRRAFLTFRDNLGLAKSPDAKPRFTAYSLPGSKNIGIAGHRARVCFVSKVNQRSSSTRGDEYYTMIIFDRSNKKEAVYTSS
jgi:hypothetical protein